MLLYYSCQVPYNFTSMIPPRIRIFGWLGCILCVIGCTRVSNAVDDSAAAFYGKPFAPTLHITLEDASNLYWRWGKQDSLHACSFQTLDSLVHRYVGLYSRPRIELTFQGALTRREMNVLFDSLDNRGLLSIINTYRAHAIE